VDENPPYHLHRKRKAIEPFHVADIGASELSVDALFQKVDLFAEAAPAFRIGETLVMDRARGVGRG